MNDCKLLGVLPKVTTVVDPTPATARAGLWTHVLAIREAPWFFLKGWAGLGNVCVFLLLRLPFVGGFKGQLKGKQPF